MRARVLLILWLLSAVALFTLQGKDARGNEQSKPEQQTIQVPLPGQLYHGVFAGHPGNTQDEITRADIASYEQAVGKSAAWVYFSNHWFLQRTFPAETAAWIRAAGSVPYIRLMLWSSREQGREEKQFTLQRILNGEFDEDFRALGARGSRVQLARYRGIRHRSKRQVVSVEWLVERAGRARAVWRSRFPRRPGAVPRRVPQDHHAHTRGRRP